MPFPSLGKTTQKRAITQAAANTESNQAVVVKTYADTLGNITAADVKVKGQVATLTQVANASGLKLYVGGTVEIRFLNGSAHNRQITGGAGSGAAATLSAGASSPNPLNMASYLAGNAPVLLQSADASDNPNGYVEAPGANVTLTDTAPSTGSGGAAVNGQRLLSVRPLVGTSLPSAQATTLPDGTLLDLMDSYGNPLGMYRLDAAAKVWRRRDAGGGSTLAAGGSLLVKDAGGGGSFAAVTEIDFAMPVSQPAGGKAGVAPVYQGTSPPASPAAGMLWDDLVATAYSGVNQVEVTGTAYALQPTDNILHFTGSAACTITVDLTYPVKQLLYIKNAGTAQLSITAAAGSGAMIEAGGGSNTLTLMPGSSTTHGAAITLLRTGPNYEGV